MNLNQNPTKEELQALLEAYENGASVHVLWVEKLGKVQITLLLTETEKEWINGMEENVQIHLKSFQKDGERTEERTNVDNLYLTTLFEKLLRSWREKSNNQLDT